MLLEVLAMPKKLQIYNVGSKGINTDVAPWDLPPEFISYGFNFKIFKNSILSAGGYANWSSPPTEFQPGLLFPVKSESGYYWVVAGRSGVYAFDGSAWHNISSGAYSGLGVNDEFNWTNCYLGQIPIINNPQHYPEYWSPASPGQLLQPLNWSPGVTWQDRGITAKVIRSHKNFLFALNLQDGADAQADSYRWSTAADINGLPFTWDETDISALAGVASLGGDGGEIIDGLSLRDSFCIYSSDSIDILDYTGDEFVWRRREFSNTVGLLNKNCIAEVKGMHFFMTNGDIIMNDGNSLTPILRGRLQRQFNSRINSNYYNRSFVTENVNSKEIWFCVPQEGTDYPSVAYVYNWIDDSWAVRDLPPDTAFASYGLEMQAPLIWSGWGGTWDSQLSQWSSNNSVLLDSSVIGITRNPAQLKLIEPKEQRDSGDLMSIIERTDYPLEGVNDASTLVKLYPHIRGTNPVSIQVGSQQIAGGPISWKPAQTFTPGVDRKLDVRTTGLLHAWRISSIGTGNWEFSGMDLEYEDTGVR